MSEQQRQAKEIADDVQQEAARLADKAADQAQDASKQAQDQAQDASKQAQDLAQDASKQLQDLTDESRNRVQQVAAQAADQANKATRSAGSKLGAAADVIRGNAPESGVAGQVARQFAGGLEQSGAYLQEQGATGIVGSLGDLVRRYPIPSALVGLGVVLLLYRALRK